MGAQSRASAGLVSGRLTLCRRCLSAELCCRWPCEASFLTIGADLLRGELQHACNLRRGEEDAYLRRQADRPREHPRESWRVIPADLEQARCEHDCISTRWEPEALGA